MSYYMQPFIERDKAIINPGDTYSTIVNMWKTGCTGGMSFQAALFPIDANTTLPNDASVEMKLWFSNDYDIFPFEAMPGCTYTITEVPTHVTVGSDLKITRFLKVTLFNHTGVKLRCHVTPCFV